MTYKPLSDEEIDAVILNWRNVGYTQPELETLVAWKLAEQARRANRMEAALAAILKERGSTYLETQMRSPVDGTRIKIRTGAADIHVGEAALAAYRGETT